MARFQKAIADAVADNESRGLGADFWISTTIIPGNIAALQVNAGYPITKAAVGELLVEEVILRTDGVTGLAGGSSLVVDMEGTKGTSTVMVAAISELGASMSVGFNEMRIKEQYFWELSRTNAFGSQTSQRAIGQRILQTGKRVRLKVTGSAPSGLGTVDVYLRFKRISGGAGVEIA